MYTFVGLLEVNPSVLLGGSPDCLAVVVHVCKWLVNIIKTFIKYVIIDQQEMFPNAQTPEWDSAYCQTVTDEFPGLLNESVCICSVSISCSSLHASPLHVHSTQPGAPGTDILHFMQALIPLLPYTM